jgi:hypothetical protein
MSEATRDDVTSEVARLTAERDEARRERDAWRNCSDAEHRKLRALRASIEAALDNHGCDCICDCYPDPCSGDCQDSAGRETCLSCRIWAVMP